MRHSLVVFALSLRHFAWYLRVSPQLQAVGQGRAVRNRSGFRCLERPERVSARAMLFGALGGEEFAGALARDAHHRGDLGGRER